jgi:hypothetical protein
MVCTGWAGCADIHPHMRTAAPTCLHVWASWPSPLKHPLHLSAAGLVNKPHCQLQVKLSNSPPKHTASHTHANAHTHHQPTSWLSLRLHICHVRGLDFPATFNAYNTSWTNVKAQRCINTAAAEGGAAAAGLPAPAGAHDPPGCRGAARLVHSWWRQAAYVDWAMQVGAPVSFVLQIDWISFFTHTPTHTHTHTHVRAWAHVRPCACDTCPQGSHMVHARPAALDCCHLIAQELGCGHPIVAAYAADRLDAAHVAADADAHAAHRGASWVPAVSDAVPSAVARTSAAAAAAGTDDSVLLFGSHAWLVAVDTRYGEDTVWPAMWPQGACMGLGWRRVCANMPKTCVMRCGCVGRGR